MAKLGRSCGYKIEPFEKVPKPENKKRGRFRIMKKMEFCPDCGRVLFMRIQEFRMIGSCRCGFFKEVEKGFLPSKKVIFSEKGNGILEKDERVEGFPHKCGKCGHEEAEVYDLGASYSDESNVYLFKCNKCGHVAREAEGTGNK